MTFLSTPPFHLSGQLQKLFELFIEYHLFTMSDLSTYEAFSNLI